MTTATVDLTVAGTGGTINGAVFTNQSTNSGTGIFNTFVQLQDKGIEQGYNSDAAPQFDESTSHKHNHSILLADVPIFIGDGTGGTVEGVVYREFRFDANEVGGAGRLLSLDKLEIWQEESGSLTGFTSPGSAAAGVHYASGPGFTGTHTDYLAYNLDEGGDHWIDRQRALVGKRQGRHAGVHPGELLHQRRRPSLRHAVFGIRRAGGQLRRQQRLRGVGRQLDERRLRQHRNLPAQQDRVG